MNKHIALLAAALAAVPAVWAQGPPSAPQPIALHARSAACGRPGWSRNARWRPPAGRMRPARMRWRGMRGTREFGPGGGLATINHWPMLRRRLGLTAMQSQQIAAGWLGWQKTRIMARANEQIARLELASQMHAPKPDEGAVDAQLQHLEQLRLQAAEAGTHFRLTLRQVLTPAQWQRLRAMRWRMRMPHRGMGGMRHGGRGQQRPAPPAAGRQG